MSTLPEADSTSIRLAWAPSSVISSPEDDPLDDDDDVVEEAAPLLAVRGAFLILRRRVVDWSAPSVEENVERGMDEASVESLAGKAPKEEAEEGEEVPKSLAAAVLRSVSNWYL